MRQLANNETILNFVISSLILYLLLPPFACDVMAASTAESAIAYFPALVGRYGQQVTVRAHIADEANIRNVTLVVENGAKPLRGKMPRLTQAGVVPVSAQTAKDATVRSGPAANKNIKGRLSRGERMQIAGEKDGYYRGVSASGIKGYVLKQDVDILQTGSAYAVTLPSSITSRSKLTYHIEAQDASGRVIRTDAVTMRLLTEQEIDTFMAAYGGPTPVGAPLYRKPLFWVSMAAVAGGAYILSSDKDGSDDDLTTAEIMVEWE
ncbi:hypothetical protein JXA02_09570 [candidate division KSB1 bacterium]|nr:hypothetical protein [candidate division KSB1 bacterium]RQW04316.1 MAG: SH3 domain-containing protein [candidate division KSB1 bacterium]